MTNNLYAYIKQLGFGVLNNTAYARIPDLSNPELVLPLITLIEEGLTRLHSRFILKEKHLVLEMRVGITFYHLTKLYTVQSGDRVRWPYPYIMDLPNEPFQEDVIKILQVKDSNGNNRALNDINDQYSLYTPQSDVLQNSYPRDLEALFLSYQAKHIALVTALPDNQFDIFDELQLPDVLYPALTHYVAYMVFDRIGTAESMAKAANHMMLYEQVCRDVEQMDLVDNSISGINTRFSSNGWN